MIETRTYHPMDLAMGHPWRDVDDLYSFSKLMENKDGVTIWYNEKPIAIMVLVHNMPGIGTVAMVVNNGIKQAPIAFTNTVREVLLFGADYYALRKCYALIDASSFRNMQWIEQVGFRYEYTIVDAGIDGQDMLGYSINFENEEV